MRRGRLALQVVSGALVPNAHAASAQLDRFIIQGEVAKRLLEKNALNVETA